MGKQKNLPQPPVSGKRISIGGFAMNEYTFEILVDDIPCNPREENEHFGTIAYVSSRYLLGDERVCSEKIDSILQDSDLFAVPVYAYIHSGVALSLSPFSCPWDSGMSGVIYIEKDTIRKCYGDLSPSTLEKVKRAFEAEIKEFSAYLNGEVYGYVVKDSEGREVDSCWGYYGREYALEAAQESAKHFESASP
jgi:hypothetical protein